MIKSIPRNLSLVAIAASLAVPAAAEMKFDNDSGGSVLLYGQFDPAYLSFDDGVTSTGEVVDNTNSNSRVGLWYRQPMGENQFSFNFETALGLRPSAGMSQNRTPDAVNWQRIRLRKVDFALKTASFGTFSAGQGSMATDGVTGNDLSGTTLVTYVSIPDTAAAFQFLTSAGNPSGKFIGGAFGAFDGGRLGRVRYDSPSFSGFTVSASYGEQILAQNVDLQVTDIAVRYANEFGDIRLKGAIGYANIELAGSIEREDTIGSLSLLHSSGFNVTVAVGKRTSAGNYGYGKLGYQADWFSVGKTALSVDYYSGSDRTSVGSDSTSFGFGAVQKFDKARVEAYLGYRTYELSETVLPLVSYLDASSVLFGARWKF